MISGYEAFAQLDSYYQSPQPEQRNDSCQFDCHHPIINFAAHHNYHRSPINTSTTTTSMTIAAGAAVDVHPALVSGCSRANTDRASSAKSGVEGGGGRGEPGIRLIDLSSSQKSDGKQRKKDRRSDPHHSSSSSPPFAAGKDFSKKRTRYNFTPGQTRTLERSFDLVTHYPDFTAMEELAKQLSLPVERVQVWFQNRRAKFRRNAAVSRHDPASAR